MNDYVIKFKYYLLDNKKVSKNTLESYLRDIRMFVEYMESIGKDVSLCTYDTIQQYIIYLEKENKSASTVTRSIASIRSFCKFLVVYGYIDNDPTKQIKFVKSDKKLPQVLTIDEIERLLNQPDDNDIKGCRDKAMLQLLYATGIKVSELIDLNLRDVSKEYKAIRCNGGTSKERAIPVHDKAMDTVSYYMETIRPLIENGDSEDALFLNLNGKRLTRQGFWKIIKIYASKAHIEKDITPHTLRHSFATHLLQNGAKLDDIKDMLGYSDISSAQVYSRILKSNIKDVYNACHPMARS